MKNMTMLEGGGGERGREGEGENSELRERERELRTQKFITHGLRF